MAGIGAVAIGVMVYMPAELGKDPTGVGGLLGLTEMGEIKQQLARERAKDATSHGTDASSALLEEILGLFVSSAYAQGAWTDEVIFTLEPGEGFEMKATMKEGATLAYAWTAMGGRINFDLHAHADRQNVTYEKGRGETAGDGSFETPFAGNHGWFWRNRDKAPVTITLKLRGDYSAIVRDQ